MLISKKEFILGASPTQVRSYAQHNNLTSTEYKHIQYADQVIGYKHMQITLLKDYQFNQNIDHILFALLTTHSTVQLIFKEGEHPYAELEKATIRDIFKGETNPGNPLDILSKFLQRRLSSRANIQNPASSTSSCQTP